MAIATDRNSALYQAQKKSVFVAALLAFLFGPLGMLYSTVAGAVVMFVINIVVGFLTAGIGLLLTWPIGVVWAAVAASKRNNLLASALS